MIVGLTGGIGSGKSTVAEMFSKLGIPVYIADKEAKNLMETDPELRAGIIAAFGKASYKGNIPDRQFLAGQVFGDEKRLAELNALIHPAVRKHFISWVDEQTAPYVIYETAILFEHGGDNLCDKVITVTAPREVRISRVITRDQISRDAVEARMKHQLPEKSKILRSDFVIENLELSETKAMVDAVHRFLIKKIKQNK
ncbi:dephospho-CoA kinase [Robertkochia solimangrovi]|uniref:dephospho-CoA kinase n=1 Tax=Robertkochia solimangrovi TaxID=2213046 RepID=UPI00117F8B0B|nr:dephospho-CoA kinase [Robertkochia solimangrovi]TRZ41081.1 dephospho-CoA kinase [Robertkochia solimangrovi]